MGRLHIIMMIFWIAVMIVSAVSFFVSIIDWDVLVIKLSLGGLLLSIPTLAAIIKDVNE